MGVYVGDILEDVRNLKDPDHWEEQEVDNLREDLEEAEARQVDAEMQAVTAKADAEMSLRKYEQIKNNIEDRVNDMNGELRVKAMVYLDLIAEYELVHSTTGTAKLD